MEYLSQLEWIDGPEPELDDEPDFGFGPQKGGSGFDEPLTKDELTVLKAFNDYQLVWPVDTGLTDSCIKGVLASLKKKNIIRPGRVPYTLTAKGKRLYTQNGFTKGSKV